MQAQFTENIRVCFSACLSDIITATLAHAVELGPMNTDARVQFISNIVDTKLATMPRPVIPTNSMWSAPNGPVGALGTGLSALGGGIPPLGNPAPHNNMTPTDTSSKNKGASKSKTKNDGILLQQYISRRDAGETLCAYMPIRGHMEGKVCALPSVNNGDKPNEVSKWRCNTHLKNGGSIEKHLPMPTRPAPINPPTLGYNLPVSGQSLQDLTSMNVPTIGGITNMNDPLPPSISGFPTNRPGISMCANIGFTRLVISDGGNNELACMGKLKSEPESTGKASFLIEGWEKELEPLSIADMQFLRDHQINFA